MLHRLAQRSCLAALLMLFAAPAHAQDANLPSVAILDCGKNCGIRTAPKRLDDSKPFFPDQEALSYPQNYDAEAFVMIRFTVTAQGTVDDPVVEKLIGPKAFAENSLDALKSRRYQPATADGKPVDFPNMLVSFNFRYSRLQLSAREEVANAYQKAQGLIDDKQFADANAVLLPVLSLEHLNFYERSMVSMLLADSYMGLKDYLLAREYIRDATIMNGDFLDKEGLTSALRLRVRLDALTGQYADAFEAYGTLQKKTDLDANDTDTKLIGVLRKRLDDPRPIMVPGMIPATGYFPLWDHTLLRRHFSFPQVTGKVDRFELRCDQQRIASSVSTTAEWHVPDDWSNCMLDVFGDAGAKFTVLESND